MSVGFRGARSGDYPRKCYVQAAVGFQVQRETDLEEDLLRSSTHGDGLGYTGTTTLGVGVAWASKATDPPPFHQASRLKFG